jgi:hypothetical protein
MLHLVRCICICIPRHNCLHLLQLWLPLLLHLMPQLLCIVAIVAATVAAAAEGFSLTHTCYCC